MKNETLSPAVEALRGQLGTDKFEELVEQMSGLHAVRLFGHRLNDASTQSDRLIVRNAVLRTLDKHCQEQ